MQRCRPKFDAPWLQTGDPFEQFVVVVAVGWWLVEIEVVDEIGFRHLFSNDKGAFPELPLFWLGIRQHVCRVRGLRLRQRDGTMGAHDVVGVTGYVAPHNYNIIALL
jgi:hypothetical protein